MLRNMYRFGEFALDPRRRTLLRGDLPVSLTPKAFDVLFFLLQNPNRLVSKEELLQAVWGHICGRWESDAIHLASAQGTGGQLRKHPIDRNNRSQRVPVCRRGHRFSSSLCNPTISNDDEG